MRDWSYEREWRLQAMAGDAPEENPTGVYLFPFDKSAVREVTFGVSATDDFVKRTIREMRESGFAPDFMQPTRNAQAYAWNARQSPMHERLRPPLGLPRAFTF